MAGRDLLEIISPGGAVEFHPLDPAKGITNIGNHADNDVVIPNPNLAPFHAILDHSKRPYTIVILSDRGEAHLNGQPLVPNVSMPLPPWGSLELDGHTLVLVDGGGGPGEVPPPAPKAVEAPPAVAPVASTVDHADEYIIAELSQQTWTIDVEQVAACTVKLINGGPRVATFNVEVTGVDRRWVEISPAQVELHAGREKEVEISIMPPRHSSSRAGIHNPTVVVTSPEYPDRVSRVTTVLVINPYYGFDVGELSPKEQTLSSRDIFGEAVVHVANKGNSPVSFRLEAMDDGRKCAFEFVQEVGETMNLVPQAEARLQPEETFAVPLRITPHPRSRPFILAARRYMYTVTTMMMDGGGIPRLLQGQVKVRPRIGPVLSLVLFLILLLIVYVLTRPRIDSFEVDRVEVNAGEPITLSWSTSIITSLTLETSVAGEAGSIPLVEPPSGQEVLYPMTSQIYTLKGDTWLSFLFPIFRVEEKREITVKDAPPIINNFSVDKDHIVAGYESVTIGWEVLNAHQVETEVIFLANGNPEKLKPEEYIGNRQFSPEVDTTYELRAKNRYGEDFKNVTVQVDAPTSTPLPKPMIRQFSVTPNTVIKGESVTLNWEVEGATKVIISGIGEYPPVGEAVHVPPETMDYILTAVFEAGGNQTDVKSMPMRVVVLPEPEAPVIVYFEVDPGSILRGSETAVRLMWEVGQNVTDTTEIMISGSHEIMNLPAKGEQLVAVSGTSEPFFVLQACNAEKCSREERQLELLEPPPPTPTPVPAPVIEYFLINDEFPVSTTGSTRFYEFTLGTEIELVWATHDASQVTLSFRGANLGSQKPSDTLPTIVVVGGRYDLVARNVEGVEAFAYIQIGILSPDIPGPFDLSGPWPPTTPLTLTWSYDVNYVDDILGFRVYRYSDDPDNPLRVATLDINTLTAPYQWADPAPPACGWYYYVRAYYQYYNGTSWVPEETDPTPELYYLGDCQP